MNNITAEDLLTHFSPQRIVQMINWLLDDRDDHTAFILVKYLVDEFIQWSDEDEKARDAYDRYVIIKTGLYYQGRKALQYYLPYSARKAISKAESAIDGSFYG